MPLLRFINISILTFALAGCVTVGEKKSAIDADVNSNLIEIPAQAAVDFKFAIYLMNNGKVDLAESAFVKMTEVYPQLSGPYANLGVIYSQQKNWEKAQAMLEISVEKNTNNIKARNQLGYVYRQQGKFSQAEEMYLAAINSLPNDATAYLNLGVLYDIYMGKLVQAAQYYQQYQNLQSTPDRKVAGWIVDINRRTGNQAVKTQIAAETQ